MSAKESTVTTRIFCISDTHHGTKRVDAFSQDGSFRPPFPEKVDILLHSGDLSVFGLTSEYLDSLKMFEAIPAELKLVIAGNHDLSLHESFFLEERNKHGELQAEHIMKFYGDEQYDPKMAAEAKELWHGPAAKKAGVTYLTEGLYTFDLQNGARFTIYVSPWQPWFGNWAFNYPRNEDRFNPPDYVNRPKAVPAPPERDPRPIPYDTHVDLMMTHGPPFKHLDKTLGGPKAGCPHILRALDRVRPRLHCFGHIHEAWGAERITWRDRSKDVGELDAAGGFGETTEILGGSNEGRMGVTQETQGVIRADDADVVERRAAYIDVSAGSAKPLNFGAETLLLNACVVDIDYQSVNAGWLVDLELPRQDDIRAHV